MHTLENFSPQCLNFQNIPMNTASSSSEAEFFDHAKRQKKAPVPRQLPRPLPSSAAPTGPSLQSMDALNEHNTDNHQDQVSISEKIDALESQILTLKAQNAVILETQNKTLSILISRQAEEDLEIDSNISLPISNEAMLKRADEYFQDREKRQHMSTVLSICVTDALFQSTTRNIMKKLFTKEFAAKMNWTGQRNVDKIPLSKHENILKVIYGKR